MLANFDNYNFYTIGQVTLPKISNPNMGYIQNLCKVWGEIKKK
jgi:hypothetical protein